MRHKDDHAPDSAEKTARDIRRAIRSHFSAEDKIRILLEGQCGVPKDAADRASKSLPEEAIHLRRYAPIVRTDLPCQFVQIMDHPSAYLEPFTHEFLTYMLPP